MLFYSEVKSEAMKKLTVVYIIKNKFFIEIYSQQFISQWITDLKTDWYFFRFMDTYTDTDNSFL